MVHELVECAVAWILCAIFSIPILLKLLFGYLIEFPDKPWKPKDRTKMKKPKCLIDAKYGTHRYVTVNDVRLHYVEAGDSSKPLIIFVHGFPEFWYTWRHQITDLSRNFWTVALDLRGYNSSEKPNGKNNYKLEYLAKDLEQFIKTFNRKKCILICHDWGAVIGWEFLAKNENMIEKYIMMGGPPFEIYSKLVFSTMDQFKKSWYTFFFKIPFLPELLMQSGDFKMFNVLNDEKFSKTCTPDDLEVYKYVFSQPGALTAAINYYRERTIYLGDRNIHKNHDGSNGMFILGENDRFVSRKSIQLLAEAYPGIRTEIIANANHFIQQDSPIAVNKLIREFLGSPSKLNTEKMLS